MQYSKCVGIIDRKLIFKSHKLDSYSDGILDKLWWAIKINSWKTFYRLKNILKKSLFGMLFLKKQLIILKVVHLRFLLEFIWYPRKICFYVQPNFWICVYKSIFILFLIIALFFILNTLYKNVVIFKKAKF